MTDPVARLQDILTLTPLGPDLYQGTGAGGETLHRIFGGHVIAQALRAAYHSVEGRLCHSLHAYFMRPGNPNHPVTYSVDHARDGGSFTTRRVVAAQGGEQILVLAASFHKTEDSPDHQHPMPQGMPDPETLPSRIERLSARWDELTPEQQEAVSVPSPIDVREVTPTDLLTPKIEDDSHAVWLRLRRPLSEDQMSQHCFFAYASDLYLLSSALRPLGQSLMTGEVMTASLDHALWFHRPCNLNDWHLYVMESPSVSGARGFTRGSLYSADGRLVASTAQEGLVRPLTPHSDRRLFS